ncbi:hypothetical protein PVA44_07835 (plasmid) [Entomospira nematocerorum]|uniref:Uncharacterized protein n=1 Tax=Entomospira nematocerorum TaxID=2719987 RepID=A0A968KVX9_9SPIO|nr:hypothetical protein [Entomospira nematocera]NIZ47823.1 hypothetical protein [Entomospira nematocera]WDI34756.1 hypothetical protein PVA44_07835 [Entomospira nematocera]
MDAVIQRRTFGEGIVHLLDAYGINGDTIFRDKKQYAEPIMQRWQQFSKKQPELAGIIKEQLFIHRLDAKKIDAMMHNLSSKAEFEIKFLLGDIFDHIGQTMKAFFPVDERSHAIELYISRKFKLRKTYLYSFLDIKYSLEINDISDSTYDEIQQEFAKDKDSLEYLMILLFCTKHFAYDPSYSDSSYDTIEKKFFTEIGRVLLETNSPYKFLLHPLSNHIIYSFYYRYDVNNMSEQDRLTLAKQIMTDNPPKELFYLANSDLVLKYELDRHLLSLTNWLFVSKVDDHSLYESFLCDLLQHPIFNFQRFCEKKNLISIRQDVDQYGENRKESFYGFLGSLWTAYRNVVVHDDPDDDLKASLSLKIYQIMFLIDSNTNDLPTDCPDIIRYLLETLALLQVDVDQKDLVISHYTTAESAYQMLCKQDKSYFRLMSTLGLNDAYEGKVFLTYLQDKDKEDKDKEDKDKEDKDKEDKDKEDKDKEDKDKEDKNKEDKNKEDKNKEEYSEILYRNVLTFVGCFTFRHNDYNQFRLYGKHNRTSGEAGGVALEFEPSFFSNYIDIGQSHVDINNPDPYGAYGRALYRCVYMNKHKPSGITAIAGLGNDCTDKEKVDAYKNRLEQLFARIKATYTKDLTQKRSDLQKKRDKIEKQIVQISEDLRRYEEALNEDPSQVEDAEIKEQIETYEKARNEIKIQESIITVEMKLMQHLAHLIKNDDYKDEDECRAIFVAPMITSGHRVTTNEVTGQPNNNFGLDNREYHPFIQGIEGTGNLYVEDTRDMRQFVRHIILGDNFQQKELFVHKLELRVNDVEKTFFETKLTFGTPNFWVTDREGNTISRRMIKRKDF